MCLFIRGATQAIYMPYIVHSSGCTLLREPARDRCAKTYSLHELAVIFCVQIFCVILICQDVASAVFVNMCGAEGASGQATEGGWRGGVYIYMHMPRISGWICAARSTDDGIYGSDVNAESRQASWMQGTSRPTGANYSRKPDETLDNNNNNPARPHVATTVEYPIYTQPVTLLVALRQNTYTYVTRG